jgi:hypothetical protein
VSQFLESGKEEVTDNALLRIPLELLDFNREEIAQNVVSDEQESIAPGTENLTFFFGSETEVDRIQRT